MDLLTSLTTAIDGKKTDLTALVTTVLGVLQATGTVAIPATVWPILLGLGLMFLRSAVRKNTGK